MSRKSKIAAYTLLGIMIVLILSLDISTRKSHKKKICSGIEIEIADSSQLGFISNREIKKIIDKEYGRYNGEPLDSLDLKKLENILEEKSSILNCEAFITSNGRLNIRIEERAPVIKLVTNAGSFFIDETGYLFPAKENYDKRLTEIIGHFRIDPNWKGVLTSPKQKYWLENLLLMIQYMNKDKTWSNAFKSIEADKKGNLVLKPNIGKESFLFGPPDNYEIKFAKIRDYYRYIVKLKGEGHYTSVSVKNSGQIVCK